MGSTMNFKETESFSKTAVGTPLHRIERWFLGLFSTLVACSWVGISLAELHLFGKALLLGISLPLGLVGMLIAWRSTRQTRGLQPPPFADQNVLSLGSLLALGMFLFFQPGEYLFNGLDASVYLNTGS